jgi:fluoroacetyl-CoA thioesterase
MTSPIAPTLTIGQTGEASVVVTPDMTAPRVGSGTIAVYATPMMVALMEAAAVDCAEPHLAADHASLGTHLDVSHLAATPAGLRVTATAKLVAIDGRKLTFQIEARDEIEIVGRATHTRVVVDTTRFAHKLSQKTRGKSEPNTPE